MSRQKNSMLINEYALNRETFSLIQFQSCFIIKRNIKSPTLMSRINDLKSGCQRKPGKMLKMSTEGGQQNKFILTSQIGLVE